MWKCLLPHLANLESLALWLLGKGDVDLWTDNWSGEAIDPSAHVKVTVREAQQQVVSLCDTLEPQYLQLLKDIPLDESVDDVAILPEYPKGKFVIKKYLDCYRVQGVNELWTKLILNRCLPFRIGAFLWKAFSNALPVDSKPWRALSRI
ncbi:hypothetical protein CASFOL_033776 [Castilleja foliolosa]|uniref:Reverse transcriptase zinc-binding domain-containing protein n=1 Tax=Castilleja foliolosa TaxID=1961234 RepID=A0ABD3BXX4_9LAMI